MLGAWRDLISFRRTILAIRSDRVVMLWMCVS